MKLLLKFGAIVQISFWNRQPLEFKILAIVWLAKINVIIYFSQLIRIKEIFFNWLNLCYFVCWQFEASICKQCTYFTLIGMWEGTFLPLFFLDWILSDEFSSKISKLFWRWKLTSIGLIWFPPKLIVCNKKCL